MAKTRKNGYILLVTIIITFVMTLTAISMLTIVYRYSVMIKKRYEALEEYVNPSSNNLGENVVNGCYSWYI